MPSAPAAVAETAALEQERPQGRAAALWLRLAVLILAGVALTFPLLQAAWESLFGSDRSQIRHVARTFFEALKGPDLRAANQLVVPGASVPDGTMIFHWFGALRSGFLECDVDAVEMHNVYARAIFTCRLADPAAPDRQVEANNPNRLLGLALARRLDGEKGILYLERIDGKWRAYSIALSSLLFPPGPLSPPGKEVGSQPQARLAPITNPEPIDFRKKQKSFRLPAELAPQTQFFKGLAAVDADTTAAAWKADINVDEQPARLVLKTLASELGLVFQPGPETTALGKALAEPVSVRSQGQSRLQAIEEVCRQVKVRPQYLAGVLMVQSGPRAGPTTTAGPFRIAVEGVREFSEAASATVSLEVIAP